MPNVWVENETYERLDKARKTDLGKVPFTDVIKTLLDSWDQKHK